MRVVLPVARGPAGLAPGVGEPLLGALLLRCLTPGRVLLRPSPPRVCSPGPRKRSSCCAAPTRAARSSRLGPS
ncbi:hypothetical protein QF037_001712 [Streptomyces canus]|uniref:hypothetical protein n=1 Tax=Streptomyces canus TaxID=58343 RepID=UPI00277E25A2|nr:hypothetical protein [Streptomyces canus]MDQ0597367.1 hypothetical protein [Streptomyces canus]